MYHANVDVNYMEEILIQISGDVGVSVTNVMYVKKIMFRILLHLIVKMENI